MREGVRAFGLILAVGLLAACTRTDTILTLETPKSFDREARILLMPPDIELSEITLAGLVEPKAEWTERARGHVSQALVAYLGEQDADLIVFPPPKGDQAVERDFTQLMKLHEAVITAMIRHKVVPLEGLPTKEKDPSWSLGAGVATLTRRQAADYGLFVLLRDSYSSAERQALNVLVALFGGVPQGGIQAGFASLVDLETGAVVWMNRLVSETGDLREAASARSAVERLLRKIPL